MRLTLTSGANTVDLRADPDEGVSLRAAENTALRLLRALPQSKDEPGDEQPFGFSLSSDNERAPEPAPMEEDDDE